MEIKEMSFADIEQRMTEIRSVITETPDTIDVEALNKEVDEMEERKAQLNKIVEEREALMKKALTSTVVVEKPEERKVTPKMEDMIKTAEYRSEWLNAMKSFGDESRSVNAAAVPGAIPQMTLQRIIEKLRTVAPLLDEISLFKVPGAFSLPVEGTTNAAALHTENGLITGAADTVVQVLLNGYEINKLIRISRKALAMSIDAFEDYIVDKLAQYIGRKVSDYLIRGTGSNQPQGVDYARTWTNDSTAIDFDAAAPTATELIKIVSLLPGGYAPNAKWLMNHKTFWVDAMAIRDDQKFPLVQKDGDGYRLLGFKVIIDDQVDDGDFFFGDFKQIYANFAQDVTVMKSEHSGLAYNAVDYLGGCVFDSKVALAEAFIKGAATL
jgi:HK97 family phage major capsid protein